MDFKFISINKGIQFLTFDTGFKTRSFLAIHGDDCYFWIDILWINIFQHTSELTEKFNKVELFEEFIHFYYKRKT